MTQDCLELRLSGESAPVRGRDSVRAATRDSIRPVVAIRALVGPAWIVGFLAIWAVSTLVYATAYAARPDVIYNSDLLQGFVMTDEVLRDPQALLTWHHSQANYAFPDCLGAAALNRLPIENRFRPLIYSGFIMAAQIAAVSWILRSFRAASPTLCCGVAFVVMTGLHLATGFTNVAEATYVGYTAAPFIHSGALTCGLLLIPMMAALFQTDDARRRRTWFVATACLVAAICYSDAIFVGLFLIPVVGVFAWFCGADQRGRRVRDCAIILALGITVALADRLLRPAGTKIGTVPLKSIAVWVQSAGTRFLNGEWWFIVPILCCLPMGLRARSLLRDRAARTDPVAAIETALIAAHFAAIALPVVAGVFLEASLIRYSLPMIVLPYVWLAAHALQYAGRRSSRAITIGFVAYAAMLLASASTSVARAETFCAPDPLSSYLLEHGLTSGYAEYWPTKRIMFDTRCAVHLIQLQTSDEPPRLRTKNGFVVARPGPYHYNINESWFTRRADDGTALRPTFVVETGLKPEYLRRWFGEPRAIETVGGHRVWLYDRTLPLLAD